MACTSGRISVGASHVCQAQPMARRRRPCWPAGWLRLEPHLPTSDQCCQLGGRAPAPRGSRGRVSVERGRPARAAAAEQIASHYRKRLCDRACAPAARRTARSGCPPTLPLGHVRALGPCCLLPLRANGPCPLRKPDSSGNGDHQPASTSLPIVLPLSSRRCASRNCCALIGDSVSVWVVRNSPASIKLAARLRMRCCSTMSSVA